MVTTVSSVITVLGELPKRALRSKSIGRVPFFSEAILKCLSSVTTPTSYIGARSRSAIVFSWAIAFSGNTKPIRSCDSLPIISLSDKVGSPTGSLSKSILPPVSSISSERQFRCPPAPWSCIDTIGFSSDSTIARIALAARFCISGLERCTALSSIPAPKAPVLADDTAAPPIPMR